MPPPRAIFIAGSKLPSPLPKITEPLLTFVVARSIFESLSKYPATIEDGLTPTVGVDIIEKLRLPVLRSIVTFSLELNKCAVAKSFKESLSKSPVVIEFGFGDTEMFVAKLKVPSPFPKTI